MERILVHIGIKYTFGLFLASIHRNTGNRWRSISFEPGNGRCNQKTVGLDSSFGALHHNLLLAPVLRGGGLGIIFERRVTKEIRFPRRIGNGFAPITLDPVPFNSQGHIRPPPQEQLVIIGLSSNLTGKTFESPEIELTNEGQELGLVEVAGEDFYEGIGVVNNDAAAVGHPSDDV